MLNLAREIWGWYTRNFRAITIACELEPNNDLARTRNGFATSGPDPQFALIPQKKLLSGWYRLSYRSSHDAVDAIFNPKIYPLRELEPVKVFPTHYPRGFGTQSDAARFLKEKQKNDLTLAKLSAGRTESENSSLLEKNENSTSENTTKSVASAGVIPPGSVVNLRPHLPGSVDYLIFYSYESDGFRFDPFDADFPKTMFPYFGRFEINDLRLVYYGKFAFLFLCIRQSIFRTNLTFRCRRIRTALALFKERGFGPFMRWMSHKASLRLQPPLSPTTWYRFFSQSAEGTQAAATKSEPTSECCNLSLVIFCDSALKRPLERTVLSAIEQNCPPVEIIIVISATTPTPIREQATRLARNDPRIRILDREMCDFSSVLVEVKSDFIALTRWGDRLTDSSLAILSQTIARHNADIVYGDEVVFASEHRVEKVVTRPAFCIDHFLNSPCVGFLTAIRRDLLEEIDLPKEDLAPESLNEYLTLVATLRAKTIAHVPTILYERHKTEPRLVNRLSPTVIKAYLERCGFKSASVESRPTPGLYSIRYNARPIGKTAIIIPTKNNGGILKLAIDSIERTVPEELYELIVVNHESDDPGTLSLLEAISDRHRVIDFKGSFNFSRINNFAARHVETADSFLFMNNDVEAIRGGWFESMRDKLGRRDVGAVGAILLYAPEGSSRGTSSIDSLTINKKNQVEELINTRAKGKIFAPEDTHRIQHAGVILDVGVAEHFLKYEVYQDLYAREILPNPAIPPPITRTFSAITAACMMMRRETFEILDGFDESLAVGFQDVDICLRAANEGFRSICDAEAVLFHHESISRSTDDFLHFDPHPQDTVRFRKLYGEDIGRDAFYHPLLTNQTPSYRLKRSINSTPHFNIRVVNEFRPKLN